jgi:NADP-dependent alcohol dehydrogenase
MNNFEFKNPTKIIFGKGTIQKLENEIPKDARVLLLYGGGSIKKNGIYEQVKTALSKVDVVEFGGIPANPEYAVLLEALKVIKDENITYLLAVGGGSVIDGTKFLSAAALFDGDTPWDILSKNIRTEKGMPFGTVLTLPATGTRFISSILYIRPASDCLYSKTTISKWFNRCFYARFRAIHDISNWRIITRPFCRKYYANHYRSRTKNP